MIRPARSDLEIHFCERFHFVSSVMEMVMDMEMEMVMVMEMELLTVMTIMMWW